MTPPLRKIRSAVSQSLDVSTRLVDRGSQTPAAVIARHVTMYVARTVLRLTLEEIGREMRRHNSSVIHGLAKIESMLGRGDERVHAAVKAGEAAAARWRKLVLRDDLIERRERLNELVRAMMSESSRLSAALGERAQAAE